jgi:uncharacterized membrane protein
MLNLSSILVSFLMSFALVFFLVFEAELLVIFKQMVWFAWLVLWLICFLKAINGQRFRLPLLGELAERQASRSALGMIALSGDRQEFYLTFVFTSAFMA